MTKIHLKSKTRDIIGRKVKKFRGEGLIPAVLYGNKIKPQTLWVNYLDFKKAYDKTGESTILELDIDAKSKANVLIHDVQTDSMNGKFSHIDFFQIRMDEKIETDVPLEFVGESEAVKALGGMLVKSLDEIPVTCLPADLPGKIEVDISKLKTFDDVIKVGDLGISEKVKVQIDPETVVVNVAEPRSEEELAKLEDKVEADVTKVEGVVKETPEGEVAEEKKGK
jgi:large subunit ribosomal protein L25